ncbi:NUDT8 [Symbiodinium sp. KB8]|nr:NUDT8 [Symbiodinium sp. KB8]
MASEAEQAETRQLPTVDLYGDDVYDIDSIPNAAGEHLQSWLRAIRSAASRGIWLNLTSATPEDKARVLSPALHAGYTMHRCSGSQQLLLRGWSEARDDEDPCPVGAFTIHVVNCVVVREDAAMLMVKQSYDASGQFLLPGGFVDPGETLAQASRRETQEETGVEASMVALINTRGIAQLQGGDRFGTAAIANSVLLRPDDASAAAKEETGETTAAAEISESRWVPVSQWQDPAWVSVHVHRRLWPVLVQVASIPGAKAGSQHSLSSLLPSTDAEQGSAEGNPCKALTSQQGGLSLPMKWETPNRDIVVYFPGALEGASAVWW